MSGLERLITEGRNPATTDLDQLSSLEIVRMMNLEDRKIASKVGEVLPDIASAVDLIVEALNRGGRLFYMGAGTSGRLGVMDAAECPPTFGISIDIVQAVIAGGMKAILCSVEGAEDDLRAASEDLKSRGFAGKDILVGISASGRTPYVLAGLRFARNMGAHVIGVTCNEDSEMAPLTDVCIAVVVGPEVLTGSTRLKGATAQKMVLNMLSTAAFVRTGKVMRNLMVDLVPRSNKLKERALRILMEERSLSRDEAARVLSGAGWNLRKALQLTGGH